MNKQEATAAGETAPCTLGQVASLALGRHQLRDLLCVEALLGHATAQAAGLSVVKGALVRLKRSGAYSWQQVSAVRWDACGSGWLELVGQQCGAWASCASGDAVNNDAAGAASELVELQARWLELHTSKQQVANTARRVLAAKQLVKQIVERQGRTSGGAIVVSSSDVGALLAILNQSQQAAAGAAPFVTGPTIAVDPVQAAVPMLCKGQVERSTAGGAAAAAAAAAPAPADAISGIGSEASLGSGVQRRMRDSAAEAAAAQPRQSQHPVASALDQLGLTAWDVFNKEPLEHVTEARACEFWQHLWDRSVAVGKVAAGAQVTVSLLRQLASEMLERVKSETLERAGQGAVFSGQAAPSQAATQPQAGRLQATLPGHTPLQPMPPTKSAGHTQQQLSVAAVLAAPALPAQPHAGNAQPACQASARSAALPRQAPPPAPSGTPTSTAAEAAVAAAHRAAKPPAAETAAHSFKFKLKLQNGRAVSLTPCTEAGAPQGGAPQQDNRTAPKKSGAQGSAQELSVLQTHNPPASKSVGKRGLRVKGKGEKFSIAGRGVQGSPAPASASGGGAALAGASAVAASIPSHAAQVQGASQQSKRMKATQQATHSKGVGNLAPAPPSIAALYATRRAASMQAAQAMHMQALPWNGLPPGPAVLRPPLGAAGLQGNLPSPHIFLAPVFFMPGPLAPPMLSGPFNLAAAAAPPALQQQQQQQQQQQVMPPQREVRQAPHPAQQPCVQQVELPRAAAAAPAELLSRKLSEGRLCEVVPSMPTGCPAASAMGQGSAEQINSRSLPAAAPAGPAGGAAGRGWGQGFLQEVHGSGAAQLAAPAAAPAPALEAEPAAVPAAALAAAAAAAAALVPATNEQSDDDLMVDREAAVAGLEALIDRICWEVDLDGDALSAPAIAGSPPSSTGAPVPGEAQGAALPPGAQELMLLRSGGHTGEPAGSAPCALQDRSKRRPGLASSAAAAALAGASTAQQQPAAGSSMGGCKRGRAADGPHNADAQLPAAKVRRRGDPGPEEALHLPPMSVLLKMSQRQRRLKHGLDW